MKNKLLNILGVFFIVMFAFSSCEMFGSKTEENKQEVTLTINNASSYRLNQVKWNEFNFETIDVGESEKRVINPEGFGFIYFSFVPQGSGGQIQFFAYVGGGYRILKSSVTAVPGQAYHVVATYDAAAGQTCLYVDGQPAGTMSAPGELTFPSDEDAHWFAIGGDASPGNYIQYALKGRIAVARMYDKAVNRDEAFKMYERECADD